MKSLITKVSVSILLASVLISSLCALPSGAYEPPTEGAGSGKPARTEGSGTRERLKFWQFVLKTLEDDRGSGR